MDAGAPIFVRIFKEESELEVWKARDDGRFYHFKTYPICNWSGDVGPEDRATATSRRRKASIASPRKQMNPNSQYYLAFNLGYPNAYDRSQQRTGDALMVHGKCKSVGCYAMTDALMEEIYRPCPRSVDGRPGQLRGARLPVPHDGREHGALQGQPELHVLEDDEAGLRLLREVPPAAGDRGVRPQLRGQREGPGERDRASRRRLPAFTRPVVAPFVPKPAEQQIAEERIVVPGPKLREMQSFAAAKPTPATRPRWVLRDVVRPRHAGIDRQQSASPPHPNRPWLEAAR